MAMCIIVAYMAHYFFGTFFYVLMNLGRILFVRRLFSVFFL